MGDIEDSWCELESNIDDLDKALKQALATVSKALKNAQDGSTPKIRRAVDSVSEDFVRIIETLNSAKTLLADLETALSDTDNLVNELDMAFRDAHPDRRILRNRNEIAVLPTLVKVETAKTRIDKASVPTQRPSIIADAVERCLQGVDASETFLKALRGAFKLVTGDQKTGRVALERIYQVLATGPPGAGSYSRHDFKIDLQRLLSSEIRIVDGFAFELKVAAAGTDAITLYAPSGDLLNVAYAVFVEIESS